VQVGLLTLIGLAVARKLFDDEADRGLFGVSMALGNCGITMAGFVIYLFAGEPGLGRSQIYVLYWWFAVVFLAYTTARHYSPEASRLPLGKLVARSLLTWKALGLPAGLVAVAVSALRVPRPSFFEDWHVVDILIYAQIVSAYFAIGLRLHLSHVWEMRTMIAATVVLRHGVGLLLGLGLLGLTLLTPLPLTGLDRTVFLVQSSIPVAVTAAAVANMFGLHPRKASVLFVVSSLLYLLIGLPLVLALFG
jgi:predicted permease